MCKMQCIDSNRIQIQYVIKSLIDLIQIRYKFNYVIKKFDRFD